MTVRNFKEIVEKEDIFNPTPKMILKWAIEDLKTNKKKEITADLIKKVANNYRNFFGKKITDNDVSDIIDLFVK